MEYQFYGILLQERKGQVRTIAMEHFNNILFHKSRPANKKHTNQSINQSIHGNNKNIIVTTKTVRKMKMKKLRFLNINILR